MQFLYVFANMFLSIFGMVMLLKTAAAVLFGEKNDRDK